MFGPRIKLDRELYEQLQACAEAAGYATVDELVRHVLEREVARAQTGDGPGDDDPGLVRQRLKGLGYIS